VLLAEAQFARSDNPALASISLARAKELDPRIPGIIGSPGARSPCDKATGAVQSAYAATGPEIRWKRKTPGAYFDLGTPHLLLKQ